MASAIAPQLVENVILYIDSSNMYLEAQKHGIIFKYLKYNNLTCRINYTNFIKVAVNGRNLITDPNNKSYSMAKAYGKGINKVTFPGFVQKFPCKRSGHNHREKRADTALTADAVEDLIMIRLNRNMWNPTLILFSGDGDMLPVVEKALKYQYKVEVWAFNYSIHNDYAKLHRKNANKMTIYKIETIFKEITYDDVFWNKKIPQERSLIVTFSSHPTDPDTFFENFFKNCRDIFQLAMAGLYPKLNPNEKRNTKYIVFFPVQAEIVDKKRYYDFTRDVFTPSNKQKLMDYYPGQILEIQTYAMFVQKAGNVGESCDGDDITCVNEFSLDENICQEAVANLEDDFTPVGRKGKVKRRSTKFCPFQYWCKGVVNHTCKDIHSDEVKNFFRQSSADRNLALRKTMECDKNRCRCKATCTFAHTLEESRCLFCKRHGKHWMKNCKQFTKLFAKNYGPGKK